MKFVIIVFFIGTISNEIGALIGYFKRKESKNDIIIPFTAGITTAIICFELLMEAFKLDAKINVILFTIVGVAFSMILNYLVERKVKNNQTMVITSIMSAHNISEGMAVWAAFRISFALGISLLFAISIHNIPEGMIIGSIIKKENKRKIKTITACILIGLFLTVGAIVGNVMGEINGDRAMYSLAISAGAMLYILSCDLIPEIQTKGENKKIGIVYILGFILGCLICNI